MRVFLVALSLVAVLAMTACNDRTSVKPDLTKDSASGVPDYTGKGPMGAGETGDSRVGGGPSNNALSRSPALNR